DADARYTYDSLVAARSAIKYLHNARAANYFRAAIKADAQTLFDQRMTPASLTRSSLWPDGIPKWASTGWMKLAEKLRRTGDQWLVWIDWYEYVIKGSPPERERNEH